MIVWLFRETKPFGIEIKLLLWRVSTVKTSETIKSVSQTESLHAELPNYAEKQRELADMSMLDEVAAEAAR